MTTAISLSALSSGILSMVDVDGVDVEYSSAVNGSNVFDTWQVRFLNAGDVKSLVVGPTTGSCQVSVTEFIKGSRNLFTIEPKSSSGLVVRDVLAAPGFAGKDVFFTETLLSNGSWYRDQGVAQYNPQVYDVQAIKFVAASIGTSAVVSLQDYLTPFSSLQFSSGAFSGVSSASDVQAAIESLQNVHHVDVERIVESNGDVTFLVTFLTNLGDVPLLTSSSAVNITQVTNGMCEVQIITISADQEFDREVQLVSVINSATAMRFSYPGNSGWSVAI
eukprot:gene50436-61707_t